jgi:hypothetical protein
VKTLPLLLACRWLSPLSLQRSSQEMVSVAHMIKDINQVESALKTKFPQVRWVFFEPDLQD